MMLRGRNIILFILICVFLLSANGCASVGSAGSVTFNDLLKSTATSTLEPTFTLALPTETPIPTNTPEPTLTPTQAFIQVNPGEVLTVPILLYHHISDDGIGNRYYVSPAVFKKQMAWLADHHYQTITVEQLANLILYGGQMPQRPVVITFDDGDADMVTNALPILKQFGFVATSYLIVKWIDAPHYITSEQVAQLIQEGWEIGSHSMSHVDLTQNEGDLDYQVRESRVRLKELFGYDVKTFAYPFGMIDQTVANFTSRAGYLAAVGLGNSYQQGLYDLYYLIRMEVRQEYSIDQFINLLPWKE